MFEEEREGWKGYIEWERYPEKKKKAAEIMAKYDFPVVSPEELVPKTKHNHANLQQPPEFQFVPLPNTNPVPAGSRWK